MVYKSLEVQIGWQMSARLHLKCMNLIFLDALASLDFKLSVTESVSDFPLSKYSVNQEIQVTHVIQVIIKLIKIIKIIK